MLRDKTALRFTAGADLQATLVVPVRVVPKSVAVNGTLIYGTSATPTEPKPQPAPEPTPQPRVRTPLDKLELDDTTRKQLVAGGIQDVEGIVETNPKTLIRIVGSAEQAEKLADMAKQVLGQAPAPKPTRTARSVAKKPTPKK
ncbi:hypothetical protein D9M70_576980 [compost metagenome]